MNQRSRFFPRVLLLALAFGTAAGQPAAPDNRQADSDLAFAPTKVHIRAKDTPLAMVVRELTLQTHIQMDLAREPVDLGERPVTLDTGETSFWEAIAALCRAATLVLRPGDLDPARATNATGLPIPILFALRGTEQSLVFQNGTPTGYPMALLGAVRVRLIPDRWDNRDRGPGDEHRWFLELLSEPKVDWLAPPTYRFDPPAGVTANRNPQRPDNISKSKATGEPIRSPSNTAYLRELRDQPVLRAMRHELPVHVRFGAGAGLTIPELKGTLTGNVQLSEQVIATIADVTQANAPSATSADGAKITVRACRQDSDGSVALTVEVEQPESRVASVAGKSLLTRAATSGQLPVFPQRNGLVVLTHLLEDKGAGLRLFAENGQPYQLVAPQNEVTVTQQGTVLVVTLTVTARLPGLVATPRRLELLGPRRVPVEAKFTLRDVPRP